MRCRRHQRTNCDQCNDQTSSDNVGQISIDPTSGDVNVGIGGGLTIDTQTGDLGVQIAPGLSIDF